MLSYASKHYSKTIVFLKFEECNFLLDFKSSIFFFNYIRVSEEDIKYIFNNLVMIGQKIENLGFQQVIKLIKSRLQKPSTDSKKTGSSKSFYKNKQLTGKAAVNVTYGLKTENMALEVYSKVVNLLLIKCGLVIHIKKPWICATPDGIVIVDGTPQKVLEIKCPNFI